MVKAVKLADIAQRLNVSVVTVSKALSGQKGVSEELRTKIKDLADEMGYIPIHSTQKKNKSYTIGVISLENYFAKFASFYWKMYQEVATRAVKKSCFTMLEVVSAHAEEALEPPKLLVEERVDGIIIIGRPRQEYLKMLYRYKKFPMVFMDFYDDDEEMVDSVVSASFHGAYQMTNYLFHLGHTKIAYVGTLMYTESITDRYYGYCKALMEHQIPVREDWIIKDRDKDGRIGLEYKFVLPKDMPTAFVCNNDVTAYALIKSLEEHGYRVPEDVSVVGYDDYLYPEFGDSGITTYAVDMGEMSKIALQCLIRKMENSTYAENLHIVPGRLIERSSARKIEQ